MHNNLKRIISATLAINALSAIAPSTGINFFTKNVQAASDYGITSLKLCKSSGSSTITLYEDSDYDDSLKFKKTKTKYYAKTSSSSVNVRVSEESGYEAKIFKSTSSTADAFDPEEKISLKSGTTTLYVRTYKDGEFDEDNVKKNVVNEYKIYVKKSSSSDDEDDNDDYDEIYLDDLTLTYKDDEIDFDFDEEKTTYNIDVKNSVTYVKVCAEPEDDDYTVKINGSTVDEDDDYEKKVTLSEGKNVITVKIKDSGDERVYTLNITRKTSSGSSTSTEESASTNTNTDSSADTETKKNGWVNVNGKWMYNDASGNPIKNTWFFDRTYNSTYYIDNNGFMVTGWLYKDSNWYYMDNSGAKKTGWQLVAGTWYYLDSNGVMKTGWFKDLDGKWYYLQSNGAMAKNTTIDGYKLGSDGAWIK